MRILFSSLVAAGLLAGNAASAQQCAKPVEKAAFDVASLKSQLMVTAISCQAEEKYNAFIVRFRPDLVVQERSLNAYFQRSFGRRSTQEHDDYVTNLANSQSEVGIKAGTAFCQQNISLFDEVMALKSGTDLAPLAANKSLVQPIALVECTAPAASPTRTASASGSQSHKH